MARCTSTPTSRSRGRRPGIGWIPFYLDRCDRHYTNQRWLGHDFGDKMPSDIFREHSLACYVTDPVSLKVRHDIGIDIIAWECDYPHSDSIWPDAPEVVLAELDNAGASDADIHQITWENSCRHFGYDPFQHIAREDATVGALRALSPDVDTSTRTRARVARELRGCARGRLTRQPGRPADLVARVVALAEVARVATVGHLGQHAHAHRRHAFVATRRRDGRAARPVEQFELELLGVEADPQRRRVGAVVDGVGDDLAREELGPLRDVVFERPSPRRPSSRSIVLAPVTPTST